jgi:ABC-type uncharacterized transport system involved in gliding motility auxiliary subunit
VAETGARAKSAKQPHATEVPAGLGPRREQLRQAKPAAAGAHAGPEEDLAKLSDAEPLAIMLQEDSEQAATIRAEQANRESGAAPRYSPETYRALALADAALARANSAKQPQEKGRVPANTPSMVPAAPASPRPGEIRNMWEPTDEDRAAIAAANARSEE